MDLAFKQFVEMLHPSFERLMRMTPLKMSDLPSRLPEKCISLLSEGQNHLYVGRSRKLRKRLAADRILFAKVGQLPAGSTALDLVLLPRPIANQSKLVGGERAVTCFAPVPKRF